jgi:hypothetical protein
MITGLVSSHRVHVLYGIRQTISDTVAHKTQLPVKLSHNVSESRYFSITKFQDLLGESPFGKPSDIRHTYLSIRFGDHLSSFSFLEIISRWLTLTACKKWQTYKSQEHKTSLFQVVSHQIICNLSGQSLLWHETLSNYICMNRYTIVNGRDWNKDKKVETRSGLTELLVFK